MQEELTGIYYCCTIYFFFAAVGGWWSDDDGRCGMTDNVARSREIKRADCTVDVLDPEFAVQRDRSIDRSIGRLDRVAPALLDETVNTAWSAMLRVRGCWLVLLTHCFDSTPMSNIISVLAAQACREPTYRRIWRKYKMHVML